MQTGLFTLLILCSVFYFFMGAYIYLMDVKSRLNLIFHNLCVCCGLWAMGYGIMLISPSMECANLWRIVSALGYCLFGGSWLYFSLLLKNQDSKRMSIKVNFLAYIPSAIFFILEALQSQPLTIGRRYYGWVDLSDINSLDIVFYFWFATVFISGLIIIFLWGKNSKKNRFKKQARIIILTCAISFLIGMVTDMVFPLVGIRIFPFSPIAAVIAMGGCYFAIGRYRMMANFPGLMSEYIFNNIDQPVFIMDEDFIIKRCNAAALKITGCTWEEIEKKHFVNFIVDGDCDLNIIKRKGNVNNIEVNILRKDRYYCVCELFGSVIYDEYKDVLGISILLHDISERKTIDIMEKENKLKLEQANQMLKNEIEEKMAAEEQMRYYVYNDILTGLSNRKKMVENMETLLGKCEKFAVIFIDLDGFKSINDNFGHQVGDDILRGVATRLKKLVDTNGTVSRIGGDEFIITLDNIKLIIQAEEFAQALEKTLQEPFIYNDNELIIGGSIGISMFPNHGTDVDTLIKNADIAMYEVKSKGGYNYTVYSSDYSPEIKIKIIHK